MQQKVLATIGQLDYLLMHSTQFTQTMTLRSVWNLQLSMTYFHIRNQHVEYFEFTIFSGLDITTIPIPHNSSRRKKHYGYTEYRLHLPLSKNGAV